MPPPLTLLQALRKALLPISITVVEAGAAAAVVEVELGQGQRAVRSPHLAPLQLGRDRMTRSTLSHGGTSST
jgi:hypothetical protein